MRCDISRTYPRGESMENKPSYSTVAAFLLLASALAFSQTLSPSSPGELPAPQEVLAAADRVRIPDQPFRVTLALVEYINGKPRDRTGLVVYVRQDKQTRQYNNLVRYSEPPRDAGKMVLFKVNNLWFYDPASQASIRISAQQRLTGQASQGDVLTVNLSKDYTPNIVGEETLQDADRTNRDCWHLDMPAATPDAVYHRIEYWVERGTFRPIKGKFYADS